MSQSFKHKKDFVKLIHQFRPSQISRNRCDINQPSHSVAKISFHKNLRILYKFSFVFPSLSLEKRRQHIYLASAKSGRDTAISVSAKTRDNVCFICFMFNVAKPASRWRWRIRQKRHGGRERYFSPSSAANYGFLCSITQKLFFFFLLLCYVHFLSCYKFNLYNG